VNSRCKRLNSWRNSSKSHQQQENSLFAGSLLIESRFVFLRNGFSRIDVAPAGMAGHKWICDSELNGLFGVAAARGLFAAGPGFFQCKAPGGQNNTAQASPPSSLPVQTQLLSKSIKSTIPAHQAAA